MRAATALPLRIAALWSTASTGGSSGSPRRASSAFVAFASASYVSSPAIAANVPYQSATEKRCESAAPRRAGGTKPPLTKARTRTPPSYELNLPPLSGWLLPEPGR